MLAESKIMAHFSPTDAAPLFPPACPSSARGPSRLPPPPTRLRPLARPVINSVLVLGSLPSALDLSTLTTTTALTMIKGLNVSALKLAERGVASARAWPLPLVLPSCPRYPSVIRNPRLERRNDVITANCCFLTTMFDRM